MGKKCVGNLTLLEIVEALKSFETSEFYRNHFGYEPNEKNGAIDAYNRITGDLKILNKKDFVEKYLKIIEQFNEYFEEDIEHKFEEVEYFSKYNNAIVNVLRIINPGYEYAEYIEDES